MRLIDADNLIKDIEIAKSTHRYEDIGCRCFRRGMDRAIRIARQQPTVAPVKHGRWINIDAKFENMYVAHQCSICKNEFLGDASNFCPRCGAKMDGEA